MKPVSTLLSVLSLNAVLFAADVSKPPTAADLAKWKTEGWKASSDEMGQALAQAYKPTAATNPALQKWLLARHWLKFLDEAAYPVAGLPEIPIALVDEFLTDDSLGPLLFANLKPEDARPEVLRMLAEIRTHHAAEWKTHKALAVALAVVFDVERPRRWPHGQVKTEVVPVEPEPVTVSERFAFWVESENAGKLMLDPGKLNVEQLKFVVNTWLAREELRWAQKNVRFSRTNFGAAFNSIRYDTPRLDSSQYVWPGETYRLEDIQERGGICVDQAYFASQAGKARGLPTLYFSGEGNRGGHAWFGYMRSDDRWELNEGRYAYDNYATGSALDPQTWKPMTDHDLLYLASSFRDRPEYAAGRFHLQFADLFHEMSNPAAEKAAVENAIRACPDDADAWDRRTACLAATGASAKELRTHFEAAIRQFSRNPDLKADYTKKYAGVLREAGDTALADKLERSLVTSNTDERSDLSIETAKAKLDELVAAKDWEAAYRHYDWILRKLGKNSSGPVFTGVVQPFVKRLIKEGQLDIALRAIKGAGRDLGLTKLNEEVDYQKAQEDLEREIREAIKASKTGSGGR